MKSITFLLFMTLLVTGLTSCKKDDVAPGIVGTWEGSWGFGTDVPSNNESWELKKNGDLVAYDEDGDLYAQGSWEVDGVIFEAHYHSIGDNDYSFTGLYHDQLLEIVGTWGGTPSTTDGGQFEMYK